MADRYWVGGSGTWNTTSTTNWSTTSGGTGGASVPTAADSVFFDQAGTYNVTMTGALNCLDLNVTNGTVSFVTGTTPTLSVAGNWNTIAATVWDSTGTITFTSTSLTSTINSNNILINASVVFNKAGATWTLQSNFTTRNSSPINSVTLTAGTLALSSFTLTTCSFISNNSNTRTIAFGTGKIVLNVSVSATIWNTTTVTGLTTTGSKLVESIGANVSLINKVIDTGAISEGNSVDFSFLETITGATYIFTAGNRVRNLVINGVQTISNIAITIFGGLTHTTTNGTTTFSSGTNTWTFGATSGSYNITPAVAFPFPITFNGTGGTWVLQSNLTTTGGSTGITFSNGTVDYNGQRITSGTGAVTVGGGTSITVRNASDPLSSGMTHNASGQAFVLGSNCSFQRYQLDSGTLSLNNFSLSLASSSAVNFYGGFNQTRTINFGTSGNITVIRDGATSGTVFSFDGVASLTISGTPLVIVQGNGSATKTISTWNTWSQSNALSFQLNATAGTIAFGFSQCRNLTINGTFTFTASSPVIYGSYTYVSGTIATNSDSTGWTFGATSGGPTP